MAEMLGMPLLPWQQQVADVAGEYDPATGLPYYREIFWTTPRQSGKTLLVVSLLVHRCQFWAEPQHVVYTAQNGRAGCAKWLNEVAPKLIRSDLAPLIERVRRANGSEAIEFRSGSRVDLLPTSEEAGHGLTIHAAAMDEIFADTDSRREQALIPAMSTVPDAQMFVFSTAGTEASTVYNAKQAVGRKAAVENTGTGMAYFEWSAPEGWDPADEASWFTFMPALGVMPSIGLDRQLENLRHYQRTMDPVEFRRAYGNVSTAAAVDSVLDPVGWRSVCGMDVAPAGRMVVGVAVDKARSMAAVAVADAEGRVELVDMRSGVSWAIEAADTIAATYGADQVLDGTGPARTLLDKLSRPRPLGAGDVLSACGDFADAVAEVRGVRVRRDPILDAAVRGVVKAVSGDTFRWSRSASSPEVVALEAVTLAWHSARGSVDMAMQVW